LLIFPAVIFSTFGKALIAVQSSSILPLVKNKTYLADFMTQESN